MKAPFSFPNSSDSQHAFRQGGAIQLDERASLKRRKIVYSLREKLLAGPGLALEQQRGILRRNQTELVQDRLNRPAVTDDSEPAADVGAVRVSRFPLLREPVLILHHARATTGDKPVQAHRLADQIGDHLEKTDVVVQVGAWPDGPGAVYGQSAGDTVPVLDRHPQEGKILAWLAPGGGFPRKRAVQCGVVHGQRDPGDDDLAECLFRQRFVVALGLGVGRGSNQHLHAAFLVQQGNQPIAHVEEAFQHAERGCQNAVQVTRTAEDLRDLVDTVKRDLDPPRRMLRLLEQRCGLRFKHFTR